MNGVESNKCIKCAFSWDTLTNGVCDCSAIPGCSDCSSTTVCNKCSGTKLLYNAVTPNQCVTSCPSGTHKVDDKCIKGANNVYLLKKEKYYYRTNIDVINSKSKQFDLI